LSVQPKKGGGEKSEENVGLFRIKGPPNQGIFARFALENVEKFLGYPP